jgi:predicted Zn finger-like uncharacterized protein
MLIVCPNCTSSYQVDSAALGPSGRSVRCVRCRTVWFASTAAAEPAMAGESWADPAPDADGWENQPEATAHAQAPEPAADPLAWPMPETDPVSIADAPSLLPPEHPLIEAQDTPGEDIETVAARRVRRAPRRSQWPSRLLGLPGVILALLAVHAGLIVWRAEVVRLLPQTASLFAAVGMPVNLRGLAFTGVTTVTDVHDGVPVLVVKGDIVGTTRKPVEVPRLRFAMRNTDGLEVYAWTTLPARSILAPGEKLAFRSELAAPPVDGRDVLVRFFNQRDLAGGGR